MEERMEHGEQVHLLLSAPGQPPASLPASAWRGWLPTDHGPIDPPAAARALRMSPVSPRAERALVAAVAGDDVDALGRLADHGGPAQDAARVLVALRLASVDAGAAIDLLHQLATAPTDPTDSKLLRKHWSTLTVQVDLAPSVPALVGLGRSAFALLAAELMVGVGRSADALTLLETLPPRPAVVLAEAAALLANGDHARVLEATVSLPGTDDVSALALVARSVAARSQQDVPTALDAVCEALSDGSRSGVVLAAALEERAHLYSLVGDTTAAHADLEALAALAAGQSDFVIPPPSALRRGEDASEDDELERARKRIARRITGVGAPGTFGGRHHSTYRDEIATMFALGQVDAVEELLLGLLDVVEDEVDELGVPLDATFFLTLADLYQDSGRTVDLQALRERYAAADARSTRRAAEMAAAAAEGPVDLAKVVSVPATSGGAVDGGEVAPPRVAVAAPATSPADEPAPVEPAAVEPSAEPDVVVAQQLVSVLAGPAVAGGDASPTATEAATCAGDAPVTDQPADEQIAPDEAAVEAEPAAEGTAANGAEPAVDLVEPTRRRELTPVERAVRGPRVRSL